MSSAFQRRRDPQPISQGWEVAAAVVGAALLGAGLAAVTGLAVASAVFGGGWVWPHGNSMIGRVVGGLLVGDPGHGLPAPQRDLVPGPVPVYCCVGVCELLLVAFAVAGGVLIARYRRPGDARGGMATRGDAAQVLGIGRLRAARQIIRPDLYGPPTGASGLDSARDRRDPA